MNFKHPYNKALLVKFWYLPTMVKRKDLERAKVSLGGTTKNVIASFIKSIDFFIKKTLQSKISLAFFSE